MKRIGALAIVAILIAASGCGREAAGPRKLRLAVIPKALDIPVFNYAKIGAERAAAELGHVEIIWRGPERADELRQKEIVESFITQRVDGIAISVLNADFLTSTIDRAIAAGIPVVTWDSDAPKSKRLAFYGVDDYKTGQIMGEEAARLLGGQGQIALITSLGAANLQRRLEGVRSALATHSGLRIVETYDIKEDPVRCAEIIAAGTNRYPNLGAWISVGGWPVFTRNALAAVDPSRTKVISFDTIPPAPEILKAGKAQVLLGQKYFGWGAEPVKLLADIIAGRPPQNPIIDSGVDVVTADNVDAYLEQWARLERGAK
ncbi:MAG: substrate-binding domain-containing protein [Acidobacteria bacterium]|nr:substrate-binding domain-containing protein [Acidobacteriota bacterium]